VDGTHVDLVGSTFTVNPAAKGTLTPRGGSSKTDALKTFATANTKMTAGDTLRVMASPDATSLGQVAQWTDSGANKFTNYNIVSSTNATPIVVTISAGNYTSMAPAVNDTVYINAHSTNTKANGVWKVLAVNGSTTLTLGNADGSNSVGNGAGGATGTITKINNAVVTLTTAVTKNVALQGNRGAKTNWTASANVTASINTSNYKEGGESLSLAVAAGFTTGLAAYYATGTLDLSAYQQVSFWIQQTAGTIAVAGDVSLRLCTDVAGVTSVHTVNIPGLAALNQWTPITVDLATNLNAAIASVALYVDTDRGAQTFLLDCIIACKARSSADSLNLQSLIGVNSGTEPWCPIASINDARVMLDAIPSTVAGSARGYGGTTQNVTTHKRESVNLGPLTSAQTTLVTVSGITYGGGWDRSAMTSQSAQTFVDALNGLGLGLSGASKSCSRFHFARFATGIDGTSSPKISGTTYVMGCSTAGAVYKSQASSATGLGLEVGDLIGFGNQRSVFFNSSSNNNSGGVLGSLRGIGDVTGGITFQQSTYPASGNVIGDVYIDNTGGSGVNYSGQCWNNRFGNVTIRNCASTGFAHGLASQQNHKTLVKSLTSTGNGTYGISFTGGGLFVGGGSTTGNATAGANVSTNSEQQYMVNVLRNFTINESTKFAGLTSVAYQVPVEVRCEDYGGVANDKRIFMPGATITLQTTTRHGSDNYGWQYNSNDNMYSPAFPLEQPVAVVPVNAGKLVTVSRWYQRDSTNVTLRMVVRAGQLDGADSAGADLTATISAAINTWEQLTLTFTPTEAGVIEVVEQVWGGTNNNGYSSDTSISQAP
jgi:hypothetical protein